MIRKLRDTTWFVQLLGYGLVGIIGTLAHYTVLVMTVETGLMGPIAGSSLGFLVGALVNHELNRLFVFTGSSAEYRSTLTRFMIIAGAGFLLNVGVLAVQINWLGVHYLLAQLVATGVVFVGTFLANRAWTFKV